MRSSRETGSTPALLLAARMRLAMLMYLRPASWLWTVAASSGQSLRMRGKLHQHRQIEAGNHSTLPGCMSEMARFEGVPPNISVRMMTPFPSSTLATASRMSLRRDSSLSSARWPP